MAIILERRTFEPKASYLDAMQKFAEDHLMPGFFCTGMGTGSSSSLMWEQIQVRFESRLRDATHGRLSFTKTQYSLYWYLVNMTSETKNGGRRKK